MGILFPLLTLMFITEGSFAADPIFINRSEWGARPPTAITPLEESPTPFVVIHHGGDSSYCNTTERCKPVLRAYQDLHMDVNGWNDLGYNFVVGEDGNVYEGRGWELAGAHAPGYNFNSIGICIPGDFTSRAPNPAALKTVMELIEFGTRSGYIKENYKLLGHRQAKETLCPGDTYFNIIQGWSHWTEDP